MVADRIAHIDGLRALAVLSVLAYHLRLPASSGGFVGVDVFFVISGYVITRMIVRDVEAGRFGWRRFYAGRARRLLPALLVTTAVTFALAVLTMTPAHLQEAASSAVASLLAFANVFFWQQTGYFDLDSRFKPLLHTWTLAVEWQFYLVWPALLVAVMTLRRRLRPAAIGVLAAGSLGANLAWHGDPATLFYQMPFRIFEFAIGALLLWIRPIRSRALAEAAAAAGLLLIAAAVVGYDARTPFPSYNALPPALGAALVIHAGGSSRAGRIVDNAAAAYVGRISYSTYLVHWPLIVFWPYIAFRALTVPEAAAAAALSIALGATMYHVVEVPFWKGRFANSRSVWPLGALATAAIVAVASMAAKDGWPWRIAPEGLALVGNPQRFHVENYGGANFLLDGVFPLGHGEPGFILVGDSHALHFAYGLDEALRSRGRGALGLFHHGCFIAPGVTRFGAVPADEALCRSAYGKLLDAMAGNRLPLVLAYFWPGYNGIIGPQGGTAILFRNDEEYRAYVFGKLDEIRRDAGDRRIILIGDVPGAGGPLAAADCILRPPLASSLCGSAIAIPADQTRAYSFNRALAAYARATHAEYVDPYQAFCSDGVCHAVIGGRLVYSDGDHLSKEGSLFAVSRLGLSRLDAPPASRALDTSGARWHDPAGDEQTGRRAAPGRPRPAAPRPRPDGS